MFKHGSIRLFDVAGTAVRIHLTFFLLLAWIAAINWTEGGARQALSGVVFILVLFVCVVLHEFGHITMARRFGIRTPDVTLLPIGGVAAMERMPEKPGQEILVALAGPAVNLVIAAVLLLVIGPGIDLHSLTQIDRSQPDLLKQVALANIVLFVFNLIPAFPMDGGRVLRALLAFGMGRTKATRIAANIGQMLAILFGVLGFMGNPFLILIAIFIFLAAGGEAGAVEMHDLTRGHKVREAMIDRFETLPTSADAAAAADLLLRTTQQEFPVVDGAGTLRGVLVREQLVEALKNGGGGTPVLDVMTKDIPSVAADSPLEPILEMLQPGRAPVVAVHDGARRFIGYVNFQNMSEFLMIRSAAAKADGRY
ncbi:MAG: site-2 protease family protein [Hyphomicrobiaceae bacterium]